ncbi:MAG: hypothetical protein LBR25_07465 [Erysipelotrichaceae bacterium]|jgi:hypothetical protein|nr:hypothetical protein [Erysipelotrichaceae bacterium]
MQIVYAVLFLAVLGGLFAGLTYLNQKTPRPEGCENLVAECGGCGIRSCPQHPDYKKEES